jgi:hypothetical protein
MTTGLDMVNVGNDSLNDITRSMSSDTAGTQEAHALLPQMTANGSVMAIAMTPSAKGHGLVYLQCNDNEGRLE